MLSNLMVRVNIDLMCRKWRAKENKLQSDGTWTTTCQYKYTDKGQQVLTLLQDAANMTLRSENLRETVCDAIIANGVVWKPSEMLKHLRWWMHQTRFMFYLHVRWRAYSSVQWTVCDEEEQKKRAARWRRARYTAYGSLGWTVCD